MYHQKDFLAKIALFDGPFKAADVKTYGLNSSHLAYYCKIGKIERLSRGIYTNADVSDLAHHHLKQLIMKKTNFVLCLFSALRIHQLTTQSPTSLWIAIGNKARLPQIDPWKLDCIRVTGNAFTYGIEEHCIDSMTVPVYSAAKTVADCFKFRNKIGIDVAIEALKDGYSKQAFSIDELMQAARINRVTKVITPYVETLIS
ncbi:MAG: type IV toxin-antitoxin system AbiEi family antitoxin domain-containing protein [Akkermansia sp.]